VIHGFLLAFLTLRARRAHPSSALSEHWGKQPHLQLWCLEYGCTQLV